MTQLTIPASPGDAGVIRWNRHVAVEQLLSIYSVRLPDTVLIQAGAVVLTWDPDLSAGDELIAQRVIRLSGALHMTPTELGTIEGDVQVGKLYVQEPSPTQQQTVTALKSVWRVIAAILKD